MLAVPVAPTDAANIPEAVVLDTTHCPPNMYRTVKKYPCGTTQYTYHDPINHNTFRSKKQAWLAHDARAVIDSFDDADKELIPVAVEASAQETTTATPVYGPILSDVDLQPVADKYKIDLKRVRSLHELRIKYPCHLEHCFDLNYERVFHPCNDIRCCGPEHDDSDIDSVHEDALEVEVEVEVDGGDPMNGVEMVVDDAEIID